MSLTVQSEVGQLRQVIVHRPGLELSRLTPQNIGDLLFDDVMWGAKAKEEHDVFAETLRDRGVRVHYSGQLLAETLEVPEAGPACWTGCAARGCSARSWSTRCAGLTDDADAASLASYLVGGVLKADLRPVAARSLKWDMLRADDFLLTRCPTTCSPATTPAGCTAESRSARWPSPPASASRYTCARSTATTRCSRKAASVSGTAAMTPATCPPASKAATCTWSATGPY
jgi:Arginine deiminase